MAEGRGVSLCQQFIIMNYLGATTVTDIKKLYFCAKIRGFILLFKNHFTIFSTGQSNLLFLQLQGPSDDSYSFSFQ